MSHWEKNQFIDVTDDELIQELCDRFEAKVSRSVRGEDGGDCSEPACASTARDYSLSLLRTAKAYGYGGCRLCQM